MTDTVHVFAPTASRADAPAANVQRALGTLSGKTIGFIDNAKPNFHHLVDDLSDLLMSRHGVASVIKHRKPGQVPVEDGVLTELAGRCDAVIAGSGD